MFDGYLEIYENNLSYSDVVVPTPNDSSAHDPFLTKIYFEAGDSSDTTSKVPVDKFYIAIFNFDKDFTIGSDNYDLKNPDKDRPLKFDFFEEVLTRIELKGNIENVRLSVTNPSCIHFLAFLSSEPDTLVDYYPKFGLVNYHFNRDKNIESYLDQYRPQTGQFSMEIKNHLKAEVHSDIYLRIFCPFFKKNSSENVQVSVSVEEGITPLTGKAL